MSLPAYAQLDEDDAEGNTAETAQRIEYGETYQCTDPTKARHCQG